MLKQILPQTMSTTKNFNEKLKKIEEKNEIKIRNLKLI